MDAVLEYANEIREGILPEEHHDSNIVTGLIVAGGIGYCIDRIAETYLPKDLVNGRTPRWSLYVSIACQAFLLPVVFFLAWSRHSFDPHWFHCTWDELGDTTYENLYIFCLFGYLSKDIFLLSSRLIIAHHILCMALIVGAWFFPKGGCAVIFASMELEHKYTALHAVVMTASNAILVGMTFWLMTWDELGLVPKAAVSLANFGLAAGRQQECQWGWLRKRRDPRDL